MSFDKEGFLKRTQEQIDDDNAMQEKNRQRLSKFISESPAKAIYKFAIGEEAFARENLDLIAEEIGKNRKGTRQATRDDLRTNRAILLKKLSHSLFNQGRFDEAVDVEQGDDWLKFLEYKMAYRALDAPLCACKDRQVANGRDAKGDMIPARRVVDVIFIGELEKEVSFIKCDVCTKLQAQTVK